MKKNLKSSKKAIEKSANDLRKSLDERIDAFYDLYVSGKKNNSETVKP